MQRFMSAGGRLVLPCFHAYPHRTKEFLQGGGPWAALKGGDAARAAAAAALGCKVALQVLADTCVLEQKNLVVATTFLNTFAFVTAPITSHIACFSVETVRRTQSH